MPSQRAGAAWTLTALLLLVLTLTVVHDWRCRCASCRQAVEDNITRTLEQRQIRIYGGFILAAGGELGGQAVMDRDGYLRARCPYQREVVAPSGYWQASAQGLRGVRTVLFIIITVSLAGCVCGCHRVRGLPVLHAGDPFATHRLHPAGRADPGRYTGTKNHNSCTVMSVSGPQRQAPDRHAPPASLQMLQGVLRMAGCTFIEINVFGYDTGVGLNVAVLVGQRRRPVGMTNRAYAWHPSFGYVT